MTAIFLFFVGCNRIYAARRIRRWAEEAGLTIVSKQYRFFRRGPYTLNSGRGHDVYLVVVSDAKGRKAKVWVRFYNFPFGYASKAFETSWDAKPATARSRLD